MEVPAEAEAALAQLQPVLEQVNAALGVALPQLNAALDAALPQLQAAQGQPAAEAGPAIAQFNAALAAAGPPLNAAFEAALPQIQAATARLEAALAPAAAAQVQVQPETGAGAAQVQVQPVTGAGAAQVQAQPVPIMLRQFDPQRLRVIRNGRLVQIRRRRRQTYTPQQRATAIALLDAGHSCRVVARLTGRFCGSGTPIRWRQQAEREQLRQVAEAIARVQDLANAAFQPNP